MKSITIHKLDNELGDRLDKIAQRDGLSLNQLVKQLLRKAVGLESPVTDHRAEFADLFGTWSEDEAEAFNKRLSDLEKIDSDDW